MKNTNTFKKDLLKKGHFLKLRPFREDNKDLLIKIVKNELATSQVELPTLINTELGYYRKCSESRKEIALLFKSNNLKPIRWLHAARKEVRKIKFNPNKSGKHSIYAILLKYPNYPTWGVYIGESKETFEDRFKIHKEGGFISAKSVFNYGEEILYSITGFFHPPSPLGPGPDKEYAKILEDKIGKRLKKDFFKKKGLPKNRVKGGH